jgi:UDP-GlcNAc:undecaprenyl-phosphate GlcNAc-1-phosphate transferase
VFILDWILLTVLIAGSRASFRIFAEIFRPRPHEFRRVLIYGAGGGGELIVREMLNNPALQRLPMGFVDDDRNKHATRIHGLPVFGDIRQIESLVREHRINEVIVSSAKIAGDGLARAVEVCGRLEVPIRTASVKLE